LPEDKSSIILLKPIFKDRPRVIFFQYPNALDAVKDTKERTMTIKPLAKVDLKFRVIDAHKYNCVVANLKKSCFKETKGDKWTMLWFITCKPEFLKELCINQRVNHFPHSWQLGRKD